ncbi:ABC transporter substrate-binding protein [Pelagibacterium xiamenense]|uniref:ABC transporter substrate-binding protein n=1 Tax=Pelagibacterium xiamenense TaxID=2901140 RepID=UPI001E5DA03F|nr:ABC transporter substrate-binding protein [Pelagibacterium xiamenense]MCD7058676.1 ABC transporter substrate-binding protein [Pelagibacterium xiamenense]
MTAAFEPARSLLTLALAAAAVLAPVVSASAQDFPLTIEHKFGTTVIEEQPERVATVDGNGADNILALGIQPVTIENWYGDYENGLWPWASPLLTSEPVMLERGDLNFELIAAAQPDVILSLYNALTPEEYEKLSLIAPVVPVPEGRGDWSLTWEERAHFTGLATGKLTEADAQIDAINARAEEIAAAHPEWAGKTALIAWISRDGQLGLYSSHDARQQLLIQLGFQTPDAVDALDAAGTASVNLSEEAIDLMNVDLLVWIDGDGDVSPIIDLPVRRFIEPHLNGQEVVFTKEVTGAFSYGSLLSMPYALDRLETAIEAALDGDPETFADDRPDNW